MVLDPAANRSHRFVVSAKEAGLLEMRRDSGLVHNPHAGGDRGEGWSTSLGD